MPIFQFEIQAPNVPSYRPVFSPSDKEQIKKAFKFENVEVFEEDELTGEEVKGDLGHIVLMPLKFESVSWSKRIGDKSFKTITTEEFTLKVAMVDVSRAKNMEETLVDGRDGTIKEYGSHGDYQINIKGLLVTANSTYPTEDVASIQLIEEAKVAVPVASGYLNDKGIYYMVVKTIKWIPMQGVVNAQAFEMTCSSDDPEDYKIDNRT